MQSSNRAACCALDNVRVLLLGVAEHERHERKNDERRLTDH